MAEGNLFWRLFGRSNFSTQLLIIACISVTYVVSSHFDLPEVDYETNYEPVAYADVLQSKVQEIKSDIKPIYNDKYFSFSCDHHITQTGSLVGSVIFFWASDRITHTMQRCLYLEMKRIGRKFTRYVQQNNSFYGEFDTHSVTICNRSLDFTVKVETVNKMQQLVLISFFDPVENDGMRIENTSVQYNNSEIPTVMSSIDVLPRKIIGMQLHTFICSFIQLTSTKTDKLQQKFFSVVGSSTEVVVSTFQTGTVHALLVFDIVTVNTSRLGMLNDSAIELLTLSDLQVSCNKRNHYELSNETNIIHMTEKMPVTTKSLLIKDKLRIVINVSVPSVSDHSFREYFCATSCKLQTKNSNATIHGCLQMMYITVVSWREETRLEHKFCIRANSDANETCTKVYEKFNEAEFEAVKSVIFLVFLFLLLVILSITTNIIHDVSCIITMISIMKLVQSVKRLIQSPQVISTFTSLQSVLHSTENTERRNMKYDIFLSYSSKDRIWVQSRLLKFLESKGFKVCFDERDFPYGCNLVQAISNAVYESHKVIAVVSPNYLTSRWCAQYEFIITYSKILNKEAPFNSLLLIKYKDCEMPNEMSILKYLDYTRVTTKCDKKTFVVKFLSKLCFFKQPNVIEPTRAAEFFDSLLLCLGKPHIGT